MRKKRADLEQALVGRLREHHRFMLTHLLSQLDFLDEEIALLDAHSDALIARQPEVADAVARLDSIPGVSRLTAIVLVAEIGADVSRFPTARHLGAWAGLAPGNRETEGKAQAAGTRKGNRYLRRCLVQAALAAARTKGRYLKALYHRLAARRGKRRAAVAVARSLLEIAYYLLRRGEWYRELGAAYFDQLDRERTSVRLVQRLQRLGFTVTLTEPDPVPAGAAAGP